MIEYIDVNVVAYFLIPCKIESNVSGYVVHAYFLNVHVSSSSVCTCSPKKVASESSARAASGAPLVAVAAWATHQGKVKGSEEARRRRVDFGSAYEGLCHFKYQWLKVV